MKNTIAILMVLAAVPSFANLVTNGDFEANAYTVGTYNSPVVPTAWTVLNTGNVAGIGVGYLGAPSQELDLSGIADVAGSGVTQQIATVAGQSYTISFDVYTGGLHNRTGGVNAMIGSTVLGTSLQGNNLGNGRVGYSFNYVAAANNEVLSFMSDGSGRVAHIDNVEVVPEPATLIALGLGAVGIFRARRKRA